MPKRDKETGHFRLVFFNAYIVQKHQRGKENKTAPLPEQDLSANTRARNWERTVPVTWFDVVRHGHRLSDFH